MFLFFSLGRGKLLLKRLLPVCLTLGLLWPVLAGCSMGGEDYSPNKPGTLPEGLVGIWASDYGDSYTITAGTPATEGAAGIPAGLKYDDGGYGFGYDASVEFVSNYTDFFGVIIVKLPDGLFNATYYMNLITEKPEEQIKGAVRLADAVNLDDYSSPATETLEEAIRKFTLGRMGNFVSEWGDYTKQ